VIILAIPYSGLTNIIDITRGRIAEQRWEEALGEVAAADRAASAMLGSEASLGAKALNTLFPPLLALVSFLGHPRSMPFVKH